MYLDPTRSVSFRLFHRSKSKAGLTLMAYLENGPENFVSLLAIMRGILGIFHFIAEF
jgi:hypothetical protein